MALWVRCKVSQPGGTGILERLNRTYKYQFAFRQDWQSMADVRAAMPDFHRRYNRERRHSALGYATPFQGAYEWTEEKGQRRPLAVTRTDGRPLVCTGLWNELDGALSCTLLTTAPTGVFAEIHDRMPLLLPQDRWAAWLDPQTPLAQVQALTALNNLYRVLRAYPVDPAVGSVRNDHPGLIERATA